ncbi:hypothetical protein [Nostoc sp.]
MKQVSKALNERITGDWYFYSARAKRPATANSTQHFQGLLPFLLCPVPIK